QQDGLNVFQYTEREGRVFAPKLVRDLNAFARTWLLTIARQAYRREKMTILSLGEEIEVLYGADGNISAINGADAAIDEYARKVDIAPPPYDAEDAPEYVITSENDGINVVVAEVRELDLLEKIEEAAAGDETVPAVAVSGDTRGYTPANEALYIREAVADVLFRGGIRDRLVALLADGDESDAAIGAYLKAAYGTGGSTMDFSDGARGFENHAAQGFGVWFEVGGPHYIRTWPQTAAILREVVREGDYKRIKEENPGYLVFYQVGVFFELYGEDARTAADVLELTLVDRASGALTPMCGIPELALDTSVEKLRDASQNVVVARTNGTNHLAARLPAFKHTVSPIVEKLYDEMSPDGIARTDYYLFRSPNGADSGAVLSKDTLSLIKDSADAYVICAEASYLSEKEMQEWNIAFRKLPRDWQLLPSAAREKIRALTPEYERQWQELYGALLAVPKSAVNARNFRISGDTPVGGAKEKFRANIEAIQTLNALGKEGRAATAHEQETLSRYVGWGALSSAFDANNESWAEEYLELYTLLAPEEYRAARASTLGAFYTPPEIIRAMYGVAERLGFRDGNLLEPACGTGNFFGLLPESMSDAKLYGVELDSVTARIAQEIYPDARIQAMGFEQTAFPDGFFDFSVGNVPFGNYGVFDRRYDKQKLLIHDYFFAKTLDLTRPGGIIAFITSKGTMDKANSAARKYIAERAELLGAVRLPNTAFRAAGTEVTTDILFLQKRARRTVELAEWVYTELTENGFPMNAYFVRHPEMILGEMTVESTQYGHDTTCSPIPGANLAEQLRAALTNISGAFEPRETTLEDAEETQGAIPADPTVRNYSFTESDGRLYFRENDHMLPSTASASTQTRIRALIPLRDCLRQLIEYQEEDYTEAEIAREQARLGSLYDAFTERYGLISCRANELAMVRDSSYALLCALEVLDADGALAKKADIFTMRTIRRREPVTHTETSLEALGVSIGERASVDMDFMRELTGFTAEKIAEDLRGHIFRDLSIVTSDEVAADTFDLDGCRYIAADEYLSGDVREKLRLARALSEKRTDLAAALAQNITALEAIQPRALDASEISVRLGAPWVPASDVREFLIQTLRPPQSCESKIDVTYSEYGSTWFIEGRAEDASDNPNVWRKYGTDRVNAYILLELTLNGRAAKVWDNLQTAHGDTRVLNRDETAAAQEKQEALKDAFKEWIWIDHERRERLCRVYNERFNSVRPRTYDGEQLALPGMNIGIQLLPHQKNGVARILYGGNTLLAHCVGAGKTFVMIAAAMESKRLGLSQKSMFVVPNHLTSQWAGEFIRLYPTANVLITTERDFERQNRRRFCARIATGDYDAIIIGHSQFERIPVSDEQRRAMIYNELDELEAALEFAKDATGGKKTRTVKNLENTKRRVETKLERLNDTVRRDDVLTFEQLGIDRLFVDEADNYKNLMLYSRMRNVAGVSQTESQKASDMYAKCRYIDQLTGNRGVIFATGTPVSNSLTEMYTMQRYLQYGALERVGLHHFDAWAATFAETINAFELAPEVTGYRIKTRLARFYNLPELLDNLFREVADIQTKEMLKLPTPKEIPHIDAAEPSEFQKAYILETGERAERIRAGRVDPREDNMLKITSDGCKAALDVRLLDPSLPDFAGSKLNLCVENVFGYWERGAAERLTQLVFCDLSTPKPDGVFSVYNEVRRKLIARGVPEHEIAFIHDYDKQAQKKELFQKVRAGDIRILLGSTQKLGAGTNVQDRLIAIHNLDCPWRPRDLEQRAGRVIRRDNGNVEAHIHYYITVGTFDAYRYQTIESKQRFIGQIMSGASGARVCEDVDETALSYAEIKALASGNPKIEEKIRLDAELSRLELRYASYLRERFARERSVLTEYPRRITSLETRLAAYRADAVRLEPLRRTLNGSAFYISLGGAPYTDKPSANAALQRLAAARSSPDERVIGSYAGFDLALGYDIFIMSHYLHLRGGLNHRVELGDENADNVQRMNNVLTAIPEQITRLSTELED
ncbi:MAG: N-6 DNA methylase, partial [Oscillospiraceae bacterium]|nr:N-6 DNA methylase [Oscillospiraceae bacterium]